MSGGPQAFPDLGAAIEAEEFPDVDLALRRGRHIDRNDEAWYAYISDAQPQLERFYRRLGCELVHKTDGYFYLLPLNDRVPRRHLAVGDMLVGQALTLLYLDPAAVQRGGVIDRNEVLAQLDGIVGTDALIRAFNPKRRRYDERVAQQTVRKKVGESIRRLARLGFVDQLDDDRIALRASLLRFADPVRELGEPAEALARLLERGEVALADDEDFASESAAAASDDREAEAATEGEGDWESETESGSESESEPEPESESATATESEPEPEPEPEPESESESESATATATESAGESDEPRDAPDDDSNASDRDLVREPGSEG